MNILSIEKAKTELSNFLEYSSSRRLKLKKISEFFGLILNSSSPNLAESYLIELLPQYIEYLKIYSPFGVAPSFTQSIIDVNEMLLSLNGMNACPPLAEINVQLASLNEGMKGKLHVLFEMLNGRVISLSEPKILFPVIEEVDENNFILGAIDSLTIKIGKAKDSDKFILVPSQSENDKRLEEQIKTSWMNAKDYCKKYVRKIADHHEIIISFDEHLGIYKGDSVGTALVIGFIEELLKFHNSQTVLKPITGTAFTGGVDESGKVNKVSKEIVEKKIEIAFYSNCQTLVIPKDDEPFALYKHDELYKLYSKRKFKIVGVSHLDEILLRRDLVDIKKQKLIVRTSKFVRKNWVSAVATILLAFLFAFLLAMDFDDNPASIETEGLSLLVKNENGKILWTEKLEHSIAPELGIRTLDNFVKIVDINSDGNNEVLICKLILFAKEHGDEGGDILCLNKRRELIWKYNLTDTVFSEREDLPPPYYIELIDTLSENGNKQLVLFANNGPSYASAVFKLDLVTGKRIEGTHWSSGFTYESTIKDVNKDGILDIILIGKDNGYGESVLWVLSSNKIFGFRPSTDEYNIKNQPEADLIGYVRFPKTDYDIFNYPRTLLVSPGSIDALQENDKIIITFLTYNDNASPKYNTAIIYKFSYNLKTVDVYIGDRFREARDSLVNSGKLNYPLTDTKEYRKALKESLLYYKNGKWVKREELD